MVIRVSSAPLRGATTRLCATAKSESTVLC